MPVPNQIGRPTMGSAYARVLGVDDPRAVTTLAPEVLPTIGLNDDILFWALQGGKLGSVSVNLAAGGAGTNGFLQLHNLATSNLLAVISRLIIGSADIVRWNITPDSSIVAAIDPFVRDSRNANNNDENNGLGLRPDAATTGGVADGTLGMGRMLGPQIVPLEIVLHPGWRVIFSGPDNQAWEATVEWRERTMDPGERSP
jgi:hypothetical protein